MENEINQMDNEQYESRAFPPALLLFLEKEGTDCLQKEGRVAIPPVALHASAYAIHMS